MSGLLGEHTRISKKMIPVLGFGLYRRLTENPWFMRGEFSEALPTGSRYLIEPSASGYSLGLTQLEEYEILNIKLQSGHPGPHRRLARITPLGEEILVDNLIFHTTHTGLTLPEILQIPEAVDAVVDNTDFTDRLVRTVTGIGQTALG